MSKVAVLLIALGGGSFSPIAEGQNQAAYRPFENMLNDGFTPIPLISSRTISKFLINQPEEQHIKSHFCRNLKRYFKKYKWNDSPCEGVEWKAEIKTNNGHPLVYATFGEGPPTTLIMSSVHPDELTPIPMGFRFAQYLAKNPSIYSKNKARIIIAPMVNPDGFIRNKPARTNANGIDPNRNFLTYDWYKDSKHFWQTKKSRRFRHFPGYFPNSEIETLFQIKLIETFRPDKILSIHAPLGFLDYDGPGDRKPKKLSVNEKAAKKLVHDISKKAQNYRVVDYSFFPGSLGNFAGNERQIPTVTVELKTTDPSQVDIYWNQFLPGLLHAIQYKLPENNMQNFNNNVNFLSRYLKPILGIKQSY